MYAGVTRVSIFPLRLHDIDLPRVSPITPSRGSREQSSQRNSINAPALQERQQGTYQWSAEAVGRELTGEAPVEEDGISGAPLGRLLTLLHPLQHTPRHCRQRQTPSDLDFVRTTEHGPSVIVTVNCPLSLCH